MKILALIFLLSTGFLSFSQESTFSGSWFLPDQDAETPLGFEFKENGDLIMFDVDPNSDEVYTKVQGNYYFESGSDLLVILTWENSEVITSKYHYSVKNGKLHLSEMYPNKMSMVFEREWDIANL